MPTSSADSPTSSLIGNGATGGKELLSSAPFLEGFWPQYHFVGAETVMTASTQALARAERTCFSLSPPTMPV
ncbi:hypothetical protein LOK74_22750 [Brevibacillus humidisoli]|uniref:hypothetical protein n=1 Tax=Brevibacillus humidisoli TaxID=2895522 RepID=UPI001E3357D3|nr:hypothetical protein [Brevibacillus humidisoli]UFJ40777.1 hypothetical protein LOK74_22750 [Brevibacillus humidisoli]